MRLNNWRFIDIKGVDIEHFSNIHREVNEVKYFTEAEAESIVNRFNFLCYKKPKSFDELWELTKKYQRAKNEKNKDKFKKDFKEKKSFINLLILINYCWWRSEKFIEKIGLINMTWFYEKSMDWKYEANKNGFFELIKKRSVNVKITEEAIDY